MQTFIAKEDLVHFLLFITKNKPFPVDREAQYRFLTDWYSCLKKCVKANGGKGIHLARYAPKFSSLFIGLEDDYKKLTNYLALYEAQNYEEWKETRKKILPINTSPTLQRLPLWISDREHFKNQLILYGETMAKEVMGISAYNQMPDPSPDSSVKVLPSR